MSQLLSYAIPGLPYGCVFALLGMGLVLTYQTSDVFNLAFGAQAYASAVVFFVAVHNGWPVWAAFLLAVVFGAPVLGTALQFGLYRHVRTKPPLVKLVAALGMLLAIPAVLQVAFGADQLINPPSLWLSPSVVYLHVAGNAIDGTELSTVAVTAAVALLLSLMFHFTQIGLRMRAMAESPRMVSLAGVNAEGVGVASWMLSSFLAGLAGVLLAPAFGGLQSTSFTDLLVAAVAAAAAGSLKSLPWTFFGGILLGVGEELLSGYLPSGQILSSGLRPAFPFVVLLGLLVCLPALRRRWAPTDDPLAACDPPPAPLAAVVGGPLFQRASRWTLVVLLGSFVVSAMTWISGNWVFTITEILVFGIVFLSLVLLTGMSGQISLCQAAFVGVGAFTAGQLADHFGLSILLGIVLGGVASAAVGVVVALPALRLGGLALALATLAFGLLADNLGFEYSWSGNGQSGINVPRPQLGSVNFTSDRAFFLLVLVVLAICVAIVRAVARGTTGRQLAAMRGSELAAASIGVNLARLKLIVFALSAGIAGVGGALYASLDQSVSSSDFNTLISLVLVVVIAIVGVSSIGGAIEAGIAYVLFSTVLANDVSSQYSSLLELVFGAGVIVFVLHPEGVVELTKSYVLDLSRRRPRKDEAVA